MSLYTIPVSVARKLEKLQQDFLWGGIGEEFKYHLVDWETVCSPIREGGLGVRRLAIFNQALLGKWLWKFACERDRYWRKVISAKYGSLWGGWTSQEVLTSHGRSLWKGIRYIWDELSKGISFRVGEGERVKFWRFKWIGEETLEVAFPAIFSLAVDKEASVASYLRMDGDAPFWDVALRRGVQDWEVGQLLNLLGLLYGQTGVGRGEDSCWWIASKIGNFEVKSFFRLLENRNRNGDEVFPWKCIWKVKAPTKVAFFVWNSAHGKILTIDNLIRRRQIFVNWCCMCKKDEETVDHLLLHCSIAKELWSLALVCFGLEWVFPKDVASSLPVVGRKGGEAMT